MRFRKIFLLALACTLGCDDPFIAVEPGDAGLSIFGYLDASADTQWIRVMPIRDVILTAADPIGVTVTLENTSTGQRIPMRDSLFHFPAGGPDVGSLGAYVHNFWTTEPISPGTDYRFLAERSDLMTAEADIVIPTPYDVEVHVSQLRNNRILRVEGVPHIGFAGYLSRFRDDCGEGAQYRPFRLSTAQAGVFSIEMRPVQREPFRPGCGQATPLNEEVVVLGAGEPWPESAAGATERLGPPQASSNIKNAVGFLGGALSRRIPDEGCQLLGIEPPDICILRYDGTVGSLTGRIRDGSCGGGVAGALIQLRELGEARNPRLRSTRTDHRGDFIISALETNRRYALDLLRPGRASSLHADTILMERAETLQYDLELSSSCD